MSSVLLILASLTAVKRDTSAGEGRASARLVQDGAAIDGAGRRTGDGADAGPAASAADGSPADGAPVRTAASARSARASSAGASSLPVADLRKSAIGVTDNEILVAYYWKGDRTMTSPYLQSTGSGQEGNVDEAKAFSALVAYVNAHANGGGTMMGFPFNLHGRKLKGVVLEAGQYPDSYAYTARKIVKEIKPFAAISAHGSLSTYICPSLAEAGIHNLSTYDLSGGLARRTNGYCLPGGQTWEREVQVSTTYLLAQAAKTKYAGAAVDEPRKYGVIYVEYPGLVDAAPVMIQGMKKAGLPIVEVATLASDLATSQQQAPSVVQKMRAAGANTLILPDAGAPLNFTHAAQAQAYTPDYFVWPCSGQDTSGMVRLYNPGQWARASGLTCYDAEFNPDLTNDDKARRTEWYAAYVEATGDDDVPSSTPLVYSGLFELLVGVTNAGRVLTPETFRAGLDAFQPYRYDSIEGRVGDPSNMLLTINAPDRSLMGDVAKLYWSQAARSSGNATQGAYVYPEKVRYSESAAF